MTKDNKRFIGSCWGGRQVGEERMISNNRLCKKKGPNSQSLKLNLSPNSDTILDAWAGPPAAACWGVILSLPGSRRTCRSLDEKNSQRHLPVAGRCSNCHSEEASPPSPHQARPKRPLKSADMQAHPVPHRVKTLRQFTVLKFTLISEGFLNSPRNRQYKPVFMSKQKRVEAASPQSDKTSHLSSWLLPRNCFQKNAFSHVHLGSSEQVCN